MRESYRAYTGFPKAHYEALWRDATIVPDTNVLLDLYRLSEQSRDELLELFKKLSKRLWMPYQVGAEFHDNRIGIIEEQIKHYDALQKRIGDAERVLNTAFESHRHPFVRDGDLIKKSQELFREMRKAADTSKEKTLGWYQSEREFVDPVLAALEGLFAGKVGITPDRKGLDEMYRKADERFPRKIPPGFRDGDKDGNRKYGDFVIWQQLIAYSFGTKKPVIFVTNDRKEDWWQKAGDRILGPNPELVNEFANETHQAFHAVTADRFAKQAREYLKETPDTTLVEELKSVSVQRVPAYDFASLIIEQPKLMEMAPFYGWPRLDDRTMKMFELMEAFKDKPEELWPFAKLLGLPLWSKPPSSEELKKDGEKSRGEGF